MKIIDKYLIKNFLLPFIYCLVTFFILSVIYDLSINLETFIQKEISFSTLFAYYGHLFPIMVVNTMPIATLMAILYELGNLQRSNEITGMRACGISNLRLITPFIICALFISLTSFVIGEMFVPQSMYKIYRIETEKFKKTSEEDAPKIVAFYNVKTKRSWVGTIDLNTDKMTDFEIRLFDDNGTVTTKITVKELFYDNGWQFIGPRVEHYRPLLDGPREKEKPEDISFEFSEMPEDLKNSLKETMFMNILELYNHLQVVPKDSKIYIEEEVDFYHKLAVPFVSLIVMVIGLAFGLRTVKGGLLIGVGTCMVIFVSYYGLSIVSLALGKQDLLPTWLGAWLPNLFFLSLGLVFMRKLN
ncbi:MAG: LptF/LptG family permease [Candidatus Ancaeobacter aquaticus]|nr:LptF/LptG family permease [Candidatus Ancaeobacter aquaticus]